MPSVLKDIVPTGMWFSNVTKVLLRARPRFQNPSSVCMRPGTSLGEFWQHSKHYHKIKTLNHKILSLFDINPQTLSGEISDYNR